MKVGSLMPNFSLNLSFVCYRVSNISFSRKVNAKMFWEDLGDLETHSFHPFALKNLSNVETLE
jgi:hypothetical protein